jgi:hypothetical protein
MSRFRISLATLLGIVAVVALGLAGMTSASRLATAALATVTLALLLAAILAAWLLAGSDRAFWVGFALFGWTYLVLVNSDWVGGQFGHDLTADLSDVAEMMVPEVQVLSVATPGLGARAAPPQPAIDWAESMRQRQMKIGNFVQIARMLLSLCFALVGGFLARRIAQRHELRSGSSGPSAPG